MNDTPGHVSTPGLTSASGEAAGERAEARLRLSEERLRVLLQTSQALAVPFDLESILQLIVDNATRLLNLDTGALYLVEADTLMLAATTPPLPPGFPEPLRHAALADHPHIGTALATGAPVRLEDADAGGLTPAERQAVDARGLRSILYVPLIAGTRATGTLILGSVGRQCAFSDEDIAVCKGFSGQAAQTIENVRLYDSSQRMAAELEREVGERRRTEEALRASEEMFRSLFQQAGDYAMVLEPQPDGRLLIADANEAACLSHGFSREELLGRSILDLDAGGLSEDQLAALTARALSGGVLKFETLHRRKDGTTFPVEVMAKAVRPPQASPLIFSLERDITDRKRAAAEREALQARLTHADKMESVGRLAGGVAHDFNNMIQAILGTVALVQPDLPAGSPLGESLDEIRKAAERSGDLTRQLLAFARRQAIEPRLIDLNDAVEGMLKMLRRLIGEDITLAWKPGNHLAAVKLDPSQLDQLVANLCVNARDAVDRGRGRITIATSMARIGEAECSEHEGMTPGDYVMLSVSDNGTGMDAETQAHIFEPFFTTKDAGRGTGLGLATIYGIVKQNGGCIQLQSSPGDGTTFRIALPAHAGIAAGSAETGATTGLRRGHETILLVEDEAPVLRVAVMMLERLGYRVLSASAPAEALRLVEDTAPAIDVLVTDVVMPEMTGRDLAARLQRSRPGLRCLFMSGYTADIVGANGVLDAGVAFIQKPFSMEALAAKLGEVLG